MIQVRAELGSLIRACEDAAQTHIHYARHAYTEFQRSIGDERSRMLVYPTVWLFDPQLKPLMQMPAGTGTFETVDEQLEILHLVQ